MDCFIPPQKGAVVKHPICGLSVRWRVVLSLPADVCSSDDVTAHSKANPPYGAKVHYKEEKFGSGWDAPPLADWLAVAAEEASTSFYDGKSASGIARARRPPDLELSLSRSLSRCLARCHAFLLLILPCRPLPRPRAADLLSNPAAMRTLTLALLMTSHVQALYQGEGGSIPFMGMLGKLFPGAQFLITGVLGPASNAHGPNEFLHIDYSKRLTCCIASILCSHGNRGDQTAKADGASEEPASKKMKHTPQELTEHYGRTADGKKL